MSHLNQPHIERKNCVWTTKYKRLLEMCLVQHVETKSVFTFQPMKRLVSTTKKCKARCHGLNIPFKDQKPTILLFGGDGTPYFARKGSRDYEKGKPSPILKKFLRQSQPSTSELEPKKGRIYSIYGIIVSTPHWLIQLTETSFTLSFYTLSVYIKAN